MNRELTRFAAAFVMGLLVFSVDVQAYAQTETALSTPVASDGFSISNVAVSAGKVLIGQLFVVAGAQKIGNFAGTAARMTAYGLPAAEALLIPTIALEIGGGLALAFNYHAETAATALAAFTIPTTLIFHNFWAVPDVMVAMRERTQFIKNAAVLGGLFMVAGQESKK